MPERSQLIALVIDDEPGIREYAATVLHGAGFLTLTACSVSEALTLSSNCAATIDNLLTDVQLGGDGIDVAERIQHHRKDIQVIVMSGTNDSERAKEHKYPFLAKPFNTSQLLQLVRRLLPTALPP